MKLNQYTIPQTDSEYLERSLKALGRYPKKSKARLAKQIKAELDARAIAGVDGPLTLEDYLI